MNFIKTSFEDMADKLRASGYKELPKEGKYFVFVNKPNQKSVVGFAESGQIVFTNKLNI